MSASTPQARCFGWKRSSRMLPFHSREKRGTSSRSKQFPGRETDNWGSGHGQQILEGDYNNCPRLRTGLSCPRSCTQGCSTHRLRFQIQFASQRSCRRRTDRKPEIRRLGRSWHEWSNYRPTQDYPCCSRACAFTGFDVLLHCALRVCRGSRFQIPSTAIERWDMACL